MSLKLVFVGTIEKAKLQTNPNKILTVIVYKGGIDEQGLVSRALEHPLCSNNGADYIILKNFTVENARDFSFCHCDCLTIPTYVLFDNEEKIDQFIDSVKIKKNLIQRM